MSGADFLKADALARTAITELRISGADGVQRYLKPETAQIPHLPAALEEMRAALPPGPPDSLALIESEVVLGNPVTTTKLKYTYRNANGAAEIKVWIEERGGRQQIETLGVFEIR